MKFILVKNEGGEEFLLNLTNVVTMCHDINDPGVVGYTCVGDSENNLRRCYADWTKIKFYAADCNFPGFLSEQ